jgi:hypothetical protein
MSGMFDKGGSRVLDRIDLPCALLELSHEPV